MPNFFLDNEDIRFLFDHLDLAEIAALQEDNFTQTDGPGSEYAPQNAEDAIDNYRRILEIVGDIAANQIEARAEQIDREGHTLNEDGTVTMNPLVEANLKALGQADMMGFTLPRKYGGLNCPNVIYTMANEIVSRADGSLMNIFGLQGIAETINAFADEEIKQEFLPPFSEGKYTGAMALTEPDAGSDLQAVGLRAYQDDDGNWLLNGVKRFITNGCGDVLLTLARSEPDVKDGRGLSLFVHGRHPNLKVRHLEDKMGIHGSPTCELVFNDVPCKLVGKRQLGLISYTMSLMNGARIGIAAQSLGIGEAAYRVAREYAHTRKQFGTSIERLPAVAELVTDMKIYIEAARALTYVSSMSCDRENNILRMAEYNPPSDPAEAKELKKSSRQLKRLNAMLTPMSKYLGSEMCNDVAYDAIQVLGGSGFMKDYPSERFARDARITTIYEGTSELQIVAAVRGVCGGAFEKYTAELEEKEYSDDLLKGLKENLVGAREEVLKGIAFIKERGGQYMDLHGRRLVDSAIVVIIGHLFLRQAEASDRKKKVAKRYIENGLPNVTRNVTVICSGDESAMYEFDDIAGPPVVTA